MGSSMAMVASGPMPGSTPIAVPRNTPMKQYIRFSRVPAVAKPRARCSNTSMTSLPCSAGQERWPDRKLQAQALDEDEVAEGTQHHGGEDRCLPGELARCHRAQDDQHGHRDHETQPRQQDAVQHDGAEDD